MKQRFFARFGHRLIIAAGVAVAVAAFWPSFFQVFRSDQWFIANYAFRTPFSASILPRLFNFEFIGDPRCQPLAYVMAFFNHKLWGPALIGYHLTAFALHLLNALLLYRVIRSFFPHTTIPSLMSMAFLVMSLHADTIVWSHFIYVTFQFTCFLAALYYLRRCAEGPSRRFVLSVLVFMWLGAWCTEALFPTVFILTPLFLWKLVADSARRKGSPARFLYPPILIYLGSIALVLLFVCVSTKRVVTGLTSASLLVERGPEAAYYVFVSLRNIVAEVFGSPGAYAIEDLVYMVLKPPSGIRTVAAGLFIGYFFFCLWQGFVRKRPEKLLLSFVGLAMFSYGYTIFFARQAYALTQPRYFYFVDGCFFIILSSLLADLLSAARRWRVPPACFFAVAGGWLGVFIVLNALQVNRFCRDIGRALSPTQAAYETVRDFIRSPEYKGGSIFIERLPMPEKLFLGSDIALETMFAGKDIFTRDVHRARYLFDGGTRVRSNPAYGLVDGAEHDFTIEFDVQWTFGSYVEVVRGEHFKVEMARAKDRQTFHLIFGGDWQGDYKGKKPMMAVEFRPVFPTHLIIQKVGPALVIVQDAVVLSVIECGDAFLPFEDKDFFLGHSIYYPPQGCLVENFYCSFGKIKYDPAQKILAAQMLCPYEHLNSSRDYFGKSFQYFKNDFH